ncbi:hypothetical protein ACJQWK_01375 [Exserohilum turcicum]
MDFNRNIPASRIATQDTVHAFIHAYIHTDTQTLYISSQATAIDSHHGAPGLGPLSFSLHVYGRAAISRSSSRPRCSLSRGRVREREREKKKEGGANRTQQRERDDNAE